MENFGHGVMCMFLSGGSGGGSPKLKSRNFVHPALALLCLAAALTHQAGYLFPGIAKRRNAYLEANPDCRPIISLGIGDTTQVPKSFVGVWDCSR